MVYELGVDADDVGDRNSLDYASGQAENKVVYEIGADADDMGNRNSLVLDKRKTGCRRWFMS